jgi:hypothetical protein
VGCETLRLPYFLDNRLTDGGKVKKACDSVRREVLYNILIEFGVSMKLVRLIKMYLSEAYRPPSCAEVKKMWIYTSTPPYLFMA